MSYKTQKSNIPDPIVTAVWVACCTVWKNRKAIGAAVKKFSGQVVSFFS